MKSSLTSRRDFIRWTPRVAAAAVAVNLLGEEILPLAAAAMPTFYVSALGNDEADGSTPNTAWATIQKVNESLPSDGCTVLFRRGDTFYGELTLPFGCEVGAYGEGAKPVLTMLKLLNRSEGWVQHNPGVWKIDLGARHTHEGYTATNDANIGYIVVDDVVKPTLKFRLSELTTPWDFFCDIPANTLYVRSDDNPTKVAGNIKAAPNGAADGTGRVLYCRSGSNHIHDVHVTGTGGCGIGGTGPDVWIHDCLIDYVGGAELRDGTKRRYGNAVENWVGVERWLIESNEIAQVYDAAWSPQGSARQSGYWRDMVFQNNLVHDCSQSLEFWSTGSDSAPGFERVVIKGNRFERAGYSVFSDARPDQDVRVHILTYDLQTPVDITVEANVFDGAHSAYSYHSHEPPPGFVTRFNTIRLRPNQKIQHQLRATLDHVGDWQTRTGREFGSTFEVLA